MDPVTTQAVRDTVEQLTGDEEIFTVWDVTKILRNEQGLTVRHGEVRGIVHGMFNGGDMPDFYEGNLEDIPGKNCRAIVYRPSWKNGEVYDPDHLGASSDPSTGSPTPTHQPTTPTTPTPTAQTSPPTPPTPLPQGHHRTDKRGRFCVRKFMTKQLGWRTGQLVYVKIVGNGTGSKHLEITTDQPTKVKYFLDKDGDIRLSRALLSKMGQHQNHYKAEIDNGRIVVTAT